MFTEQLGGCKIHTPNFSEGNKKLKESVDMKHLSYLLYPRGPFEATTSFSDLAIPPPVWPDLGSAPEADSADHDFLALLKALFCC